MKRILALSTAVSLALLVFLWGGVSSGGGPGKVAPSNLTVAPVNPAYLEYQQQKAAGALKTHTSGGHALGYRPPIMDLSHVHQNPVDISKGKGAPPPSFDWRYANGVTAVRDQGQCGSCWAFATMGALEAFFRIRDGNNFYLSVNNMASCQWPYLLGRCDGGNSFMSTGNLVGLVWNPLKGGYYDNKPRGALTNSKDPYKEYSHNDKKCYKRPAPLAMVDSVRWIAADATTLKNAIMNYGPVTTALYMTEDAPWWNPATATLNYPSPPPNQTNHMVVLVGWDDHNNVWIAKNSWGKKWGDKGYFYITYGSANIAIYDNLAFEQTRFYNKYELLYVEDLPGMMTGAGSGINPCTYYAGLVFSPSYDYEWLTAVEFYTTAPGTQYVIKVWETVSHPSSTTVQFSGNVLFTASGTAGEMGYYTVAVPTQPQLTYPNEYGVEVKLYNPIFPWPLPIAYPDPSDPSFPVDNFWDSTSGTTYSSTNPAPGGTFSWLNVGGIGHSAIGIRARTEY